MRDSVGGSAEGIDRRAQSCAQNVSVDPYRGKQNGTARAVGTAAGNLCEPLTRRAQRR
jgi:hypothetical protein